MPDNADTYAFFVASSRRLGIRTFMTQNIGALPKNRGEKQKEDQEEKKGFKCEDSRRIEENNPPLSDRQL